MIFNKYTVLLTIMIVSGLNLNAQKTFEEMQKIEKSFFVAKDASIQIVNKYGNVHVSTWEKDSVEFNIDFIVRANKPERLTKLMNLVSFDFDNSPNFIIGQTIINKNSILTDVASMTNAMFGSGTNIIINYNVKIPVKSNIKVENKFGDIFITDIDGNANIILSNGDLKIGNIKGDIKLKHSFGNATIKNFNNGRFTLSFSEIEMGKTKDVFLESSSSRIQIDEVQMLEYNLKNDKLYISNIEIINGKSNLSNINIKKLSKQAIVTSTFGNFNIDELSKNFMLLNINSSYTNYTIFTSRDCSFSFDITYKKTDISLPTSIQNFNKEQISPKTSDFKITGNYGAAINPSSRIKVNSNAGNLYLYEK